MIDRNNEINAGDSSTNIQGKTVNVNHTNYGLGYLEVKEIFMDLFKNNFYNLGQEASEVARQRAEEIVNEFLERLQKDSPQSIDNTNDPDVQYAIINAQKGYARSGEKDISSLLVDLLVERTKENEQPLFKLILNEAIEALPKLTLRQIDTLTFVFLCRYVALSNVFTIHQCYEVFNIFANEISENHFLYQHLQFLGCISISIGSYDFARVVPEKYPDIFPNSKDETSVVNILNEVNPDFIRIMNGWENTSLKSSSLTSVGLAIAITNLNKKTGVNLSLKEWIGE
jgi:hypothetical protein